MQTLWQTRTKSSLLHLASALVLVLALPACGQSAALGVTLTLGGSSFTGSTDVTIHAGDSVTFDNTNGGIHRLVTGTNGTLAVVVGGPVDLTAATGLALSPGDRKAVTFTQAGTYQITCQIHPSMLATVHVTA
jgi:plastocyanin